MNLLLLLSAILSALTGAVGSSRAVATPAVAACTVVTSAAEAVADRPTTHAHVAARASLMRIIDRAAFALTPRIALHQDRPLE